MKTNTYQSHYHQQIMNNIRLCISKLMLVVFLWQLVSSSFVLATIKHADKEKIAKISDGKTNEKTVTNIVTASINTQLAGDTVVMRHGTNFNGIITGSVRVLLGENINLNTNSRITGDLLVPGTPSVNTNGNTSYNGTVGGDGSPQPSGYTINLSNNTVLRHVVTKTDPITISPVNSPPQSAGTRDVTLSKGDLPGDFSTIRNLTINSNYGNLDVPQGTYENLVANSNSSYTFGVIGQSTIYNLQNLTLNSNSQLNVLGNVTINVQSNVILSNQVTMGDVNSPISLALNIARGNLSISSNSTFYGVVKTPNGQVSLNSNSLLKGLIICNQLNANSNSIILSMIPDVTPPQVTITQPVNDQIVTTPTITVNGTFQDDSVVTSVKVNNVDATISGNNFTASSVPVSIGSNTLTATATDIAGNVGSSQITIMRGDGTNQPPVVNAGLDQTINLTSSANLVGTATDDGKPNPPGQLTYAWSKVNGNGTVVFSSPNSLTTSATFSTTGSYTLKLKASDSQLTSEDIVVITVSSQQNQPPVVNAGNNQTITLPSTASLLATATDDGLPNPPGQLTYLWTKVSGSGTVSFSSATSLTTSATFSTAGTYVLSLTANDSQLSTSSNVTIVVNPQATQNTAPVVNAGPNQTITLPATATLNGTATDDGLPNPPGQLTISWTKVGGPGVVTFTNNGTTAQTQATFSIAGTYTLRLSASDSSLVSSNDVIVIVNPVAINQPPVVSAGADQTVVLPDVITVTGTATDDGLPGNTLTYSWTKASGPGDVNFVTPTALSSTVVFSVEGVYVLRLTASDGVLSTSADVKITLKVIPRIIIYSNADNFEPNAINTTAGDKLLMIRNRSGFDVHYVFTQGTQSLTVLAPNGKNTFINVTLAQGTAALTSSEFPTWNLTFTVVP